MSKASKIILGILVTLVIVMIVAEVNAPQPVDWSDSYYRKDKIPKGSFLFYEQLSEVAPELQLNEKPPYEFLQDSTRSGTYFFMNSFYGTSKDEVKKMLEFSARGNTVFIASQGFGSPLTDTLHFHQKSKYSNTQLKQFPQYKLKSSQFDQKTFSFPHDENLIYFDSLDTSTTEVLGYAKFKNDTTDFTKTPNFLKVAHGKGTIFLHSNPEVFTNYFLLQEGNIDYLEKLLAYLDLRQQIYWDGFHKAGKPQTEGILSVLMTDKYLKWTYYLMLFSGILFIVFEGKRKQKKIPVIKPLPNKTFDYTRTVAGMYLDKGGHRIIVDKQVAQLLAFIRQRFGVLTETIDNQLIAQISAKSNIPKREIEDLFQYIDTLQQKGKRVSQEELITLNHRIKDFKTQI